MVGFRPFSLTNTSIFFCSSSQREHMTDILLRTMVYKEKDLTAILGMNLIPAPG